MIHNVDYHFHPNLPKGKKRARVKCHKIWASYEKQNINTVIVTEHNFKNPERAFRIMKETKPEHCHVFPGMEHVTEEGIDVLIFHRDETIYQCKSLAPFALSLEDTIKIAEENNYACCLAHPHSLAQSSIIKRLGHEKYFEYLNLICAVEISNASFDNLVKIFEKPILRKIFKNKLINIYNTKKLPESDYPEKIKFLAVGSDAHHPKQIGTHCSIEVNGEDLFDRITSNINPYITEKILKKTDFRILLISAYITFFEGLQKKKISFICKRKWKTLL